MLLANRDIAYPLNFTIRLDALPLHNSQQQLLEFLVVWLLLKLDAPAVSEKLHHLLGKATTEHFNRSHQFLFHYLFVSLFLAVRTQILPRQSSLQKIYEDIGKAFNIVSTALLYSQVSIERGIPSCPCQILVVLIGDVHLLLGHVLLGQPEVYEINSAAVFANPHQEVVRLHVSVYEVFGMHELQPLQHLVPHYHHTFQLELAIAATEDVLEGLSQQIHNHEVVLALGRAHIVMGDSSVHRLVVVEKV